MLSNSIGQVNNEQAIFPLISFDHATSSFRCLGTAFFIHQDGWFVTAKHNLYNRNGKVYPMMMAVQSLADSTRITREITHLCIHPDADIAIGQLGIARNPKTAEPVPHEATPPFQLLLKRLSPNDEVIGYGYPKTKKTIVGTEYTFHMTGKWSSGCIVGYHESGTIVKNRCYQTTLQIDSGASGGPVFWNNMVIGVNSSGFDLYREETPLSFVTTIDYILDLQVSPVNGLVMPVRELIQLRHISGFFEKLMHKSTSSG